MKTRRTTWGQYLAPRKEPDPIGTALGAGYGIAGALALLVVVRRLGWLP